MKDTYIVQWRMYGCKDWCSIRVKAFGIDDALATANRQLNNHMIQFGDVEEVDNGMGLSDRLIWSPHGTGFAIS